MQYLPCDFHDFRGSEGPEICKNRTESLKNTSENASLEKTVFGSRFLSIFDPFRLPNAPSRAPQSTPKAPQELPGPPQKPPEKLPRAPGVDLPPGSILEPPGPDFGPISPKSGQLWSTPRNSKKGSIFPCFLQENSWILELLVSPVPIRLSLGNFVRRHSDKGQGSHETLL